MTIPLLLFLLANAVLAICILDLGDDEPGKLKTQVDIVGNMNVFTGIIASQVVCYQSSNKHPSPQ